MDEARERVEQALDRCRDERVLEWGSIKSNIRDALGRYLFDKTRRRPPDTQAPEKDSKGRLGELRKEDITILADERSNAVIIMAAP